MRFRAQEAARDVALLVMAAGFSGVVGRGELLERRLLSVRERG